MDPISAAFLGVSVIGGLLGSSAEAEAQKMQAEFQANQLEFQADLYNLQAKDAITRGKAEAGNLSLEAKKLKGSQRAAAAGQGIDVEYGSAKDIVDETTKLTTIDMLTIQNNADREAFGFKTNALMSKISAGATRQSGKASANATMLTGGARALGTIGNAYAQSIGYGKKGG